LLFILIKIYRLGFSNSNFPPLFKKCEERRIFWLLVIVNSNPDLDFMFVHTLLMFLISIELFKFVNNGVSQWASNERS